MLTLFTIPKSFHGHTGIIQRNAIQSWLHLRPACEIILLGDDEGTAEIAAEFKLRHVAGVARNQYGTPLVNSVFGEAEKAATYPLMCYINADIILMSDFLDAIQRVKNMKNFLLVGQRRDLNSPDFLDFAQPDWEQRLHFSANKNGVLHPPTGIDYFVFPRGLFGYIPPFAIGRTAWDGWLIYRSHTSGAKVIDATFTVMAIHQNHDYSHYPGGQRGILKSPEVRLNLKLARGWRHQFTINDARYILTPEGLIPIPIGKHIKERLRYLFLVPVRKKLKTILKRE